MESIATSNNIYYIFWDKSKLYNKSNTNVMYNILELRKKEMKKRRVKEKRSIIITGDRVYDDSS